VGRRSRDQGTALSCFPTSRQHIREMPVSRPENLGVKRIERNLRGGVDCRAAIVLASSLQIVLVLVLDWVLGRERRQEGEIT
jgi:hypothetical protein